MADPAYQKWFNPVCGAEFDCDRAILKCLQCGDLLDARYGWEQVLKQQL